MDCQRTLVIGYVVEESLRTLRRKRGRTYALEDELAFLVGLRRLVRSILSASEMHERQINARISIPESSRTSRMRYRGLCAGQ